MGIGAAVRTRLGPLETPAAEAYRRAFVDLDQLTAGIAAEVGPARRVLEIGCGDGSMAERLVTAFPDAHYLGVDLCPAPGRRFRGDRARARFRQQTSTQLVAAGESGFDVVVLVDVLHHIPAESERVAVLRDAAALGEVIVVKDWDAHLSIAHGLQVLADRYLSGDRTVRFSMLEGFFELFRVALPGWRLDRLDGVGPWCNNVVMTWRPG